MYIYEQKKWPLFRWSDRDLLCRLGEARNAQGLLIGKIQTLGFKSQDEAYLEALTNDVVNSTAIEGVLLNEEHVRSSVAETLGLEYAGVRHNDRMVEGVVAMMVDATRNYQTPLDRERLFSWHRSIFPTAGSGLIRIPIGRWRDDASGDMRVVSGRLGSDRVHFQAPPASAVDSEMIRFFSWFNNKKDDTDLMIRAGIAHLWFVTIHPFEDGNGRIARALADMFLAASDNLPQRFYSMSRQILEKRKAYYDLLENTQRGGLDITEWLCWFLGCLREAIASSSGVLDKVLRKHMFWMKYGEEITNDRQRRVLNRLLGDFEGKLTSAKWAKLVKCSHDTALRDIRDLIRLDILRKTDQGGRSTSYELCH
jgi:Fic family protein